jgi:glycosyltransferase involved in cell wall biosynthesis
MPSVSVIIPTFNRQAVIERALESIYAQSSLPSEVIVVDDGSNDDTATLIKNNFPDVIYLYQENSGVSAARNRGILEAKGQWLAFLDSDDEWLPKKLETQLNALSEQPDLKICHTEEKWIRNGKRVNQMNKHAKSGGWIFNKCLPLCAMSPSSIIIHRTLFNELGGFDENLPACEDYDLWLRVASRYSVLYIKTPQIIKYGGHDDQLSRKFWGMDRFRIASLEKIINSGLLSKTDKEAAVAMLLKKANIYLKGLRKRDKTVEIEYYETLCLRFSQLTIL